MNVKEIGLPALPGRLSPDCFSTPLIPHSWGESKRVGGHPQALGSILLHLSYVIPAELVLVETGSGNPVVKRVERNETADTVSRLSPHLSLRGAGGDAAISGRGDCFAFPPAALGEWLAITRSRGTPPNSRQGPTPFDTTSRHRPKVKTKIA